MLGISLRERDSLVLSWTFKLPVLAADTSASQSVGGMTGSFMKCAVFSGVTQVLLVSKASGSVFKASAAAGTPLEAAVQGAEILIVRFTRALEKFQTQTVVRLSGLLKTTCGLSPLIKQVFCTWLDNVFHEVETIPDFLNICLDLILLFNVYSIGLCLFLKESYVNKAVIQLYNSSSLQR